MFELADVETFLVLADELHFGRAAERLVVTRARVSQRIQTFERHVGGPLFVRTTRRVTLTPLGRSLVDQLRPAYDALHAAVEDAQTQASQLAGTLRVGYSAAIQGAALKALFDDFRAAYPAVSLTLIEVMSTLPFDTLRAGYVDALLFWQTIPHPDVEIGPPIGARERMLAVAATHPLARRASVTTEDLVDHQVADFEIDPDARLHAGIVPTHTRSGRPIPRHPGGPATLPDLLRLVEAGEIVHPTVDFEYPLFGPGTVLIPITDLPVMPYGPMWLNGRSDPRVRALVDMVAAKA